ncbi:MAG: DNA-directed RNA polymerase subunit omega [Oscillospiraceae bacterium]|nr:DNA-directed RNA polymerase subunit omega [Oscillospiraceae bacterium]
MMLRPSMYQIISKNESYYSLVVGVAKRAREIAEQHVKEKEEAKAAAEKRAKMNGDQKIRLDDKTVKMVVLEENPVKTAVDEFAAGKYKLVDPELNSER